MLERCRVPELMDDPELEEGLHLEALAGLASLNALSGSASILWKEIFAEVASSSTRPLSILDVATGGGDIPIDLYRRARAAKIELSINACDFSQRSVEFAQQRASAVGADVRFFKLDVIKEPLPAGFDVIISSLFFHHISNEEAVRLLRNMSQAASKLVLVNDLERSAVNLGLVWLGSRLLSRSPVVHFDGPASVKAAFRIEEVQEIAREAGLVEAHIERKFPSRFLLSWRKPPEGGKQNG
jgi:SAM-dependent methyltransferase